VVGDVNAEIGEIGSENVKTSRVLAGLCAASLLVAACGRSGDPDISVAGTSTEATAATTTTTAAESATVPTTAPPTTQLTYVIQSGDSLSVIAQRFGISTQDLADFNAIADVDAIQVGQEISIPPSTVAPATTASTAAEAESTTTASE